MYLEFLLSQLSAREPAPIDRPTPSCMAAEFDLANAGMASALLHEVVAELHDHCAASR